jgi:sulfate adenylyltransferase subunit 1 (EFTu-like GTPase family)
MPDYAAIFLPGQRITLQASGTITGGDLLAVSGSGTVAKAAALASTAYVGVAGHDATAGQKVTVVCAGVVHESIADGAVTAGDQLTTTNTANRQVKSLAPAAVAGAPPLAADVNLAINQARAVIGIALTSAADNALTRWLSR